MERHEFVTTQRFTQLYEQLREATVTSGVAGSMLLRRALGILSVDGVVGLVDHCEELDQLVLNENDQDRVPERQSPRANVPKELVHILTDVALAVASTEIIR